MNSEAIAERPGASFGKEESELLNISAKDQRNWFRIDHPGMMNVDTNQSLLIDHVDAEEQKGALRGALASSIDGMFTQEWFSGLSASEEKTDREC